MSDIDDLFGRRCGDYDPDCATCFAYKQQDEIEKLRAAVNALVPVVETFVNPIRSPDFNFAMQYQNEWRNEGAKALVAAAAALKETDNG